MKNNDSLTAKVMHPPLPNSAHKVTGLVALSSVYFSNFNVFGARDAAKRRIQTSKKLKLLGGYASV
jgi:hypothetical protein